MSTTASGGYYGRIAGTTTDMEYSTSTSGPWTGCSSEGTAVYPGTYYVRYKLTGTHLASEATTVTVGPTKPDNTQTTPETVEYTGAEQTFVPSGLNTNWVKIEGDTKATNPTDDVYTVTVTPYGCWSDGNSDTVNYYWKIVKKTLTTDNFTFTGNEITYDGSAHGSDDITVDTAGLTGFPDADITELKNSLSLVFENTGDKVNCDTYGFTLSGVDTTKFTTADSTGKLNGSWKMTIIQKAPEAKDFVVSDNETPYDGGEHTATVGLNSTKYPVAQPDTVSTWLSWTVGGAEKQVNANEAGYEIKVTVNGSQNFSNKTVTLNSDDNNPYLFYINKKELADGDFTISYQTDDSKKFDTSEHKPSIELNAKYKTQTVDDYSWLTCKIGGADSKTDAGTYPITVYVADSTNNTNFKTASGVSISGWSNVGLTTFTIDKHTLTKDDFSITYPGDDLVYDRGTHTPTVEFIDLYKNYYSGKDTSWLTWKVGTSWPTTVTDEHSQIDAGSYDIVATIAENTNFTTDSSLNIGTMTISRATLTAADFTIAYKDDGQDSTTNSFVYNTKNKSATAALTNGDTLDGLTVKYFKNEATTGNVSPVKDVGEYKIKLYCNETTNYNEVDGITNESWKITITPANLTLVAGGKYTISKTYNGSGDDVRFTVEALSGDRVTMKLEFSKTYGDGSISNIETSNVSEVVFSQTFTNVKDSGIWTWTASAEGGNYNALNSTDGTDGTKIIVDISKATLAVSQETLSWGTTGTAKTYDAAGHDVGVTVSAYEGNTITISYTWNYTKTSTSTTNTVTGSDVEDSEGNVKNVATLKLTARDVKQSGTITWTASAGDNYDNYVSTAKGKNLTVNIAEANLTVDSGAVYKIGKTYNGSGDDVKFTVKALENDHVNMKIVFTTESSGSGDISDATSSGNNVSFSKTFTHVAESGIWKWTASAGDNYNTLSSTDGTGSTSDTRVTVDITQFDLSPNVTVTPSGGYSGTYDGVGHAFEVTYTLVGEDLGKTNLIEVTYGRSSTSVGGDLDDIKETYYTGGADGSNPGKTAYYKLSYCADVQYEDYALPAVGSSIIKIEKLPLTGEITLDEETIEDAAEGMTATIQYNGKPRTLSAAATNLKNNDEAVATYRLNGADISETDLAAVLKNMGTYVVEVKVSAKSGEGILYTDSYTPFVRTVTVNVEEAAVKIVDFSYGTVTEGDKMTMTVTMESVGTLDGTVTVECRGQTIDTECSIVDNGDGTYTATVVYDTSLGTIPSGTLQTITVAYPGDDNHSASAPTDHVIRIRSAGMPYVPEEGGQVPIDPEQEGVEVETPAGDIRFDLIDPPVLEEGDTIVIDVMMRYASEEEQVPDEESTIVLNTEGYVLHSDGSKTPIKYRVTPSVKVVVPSDMKPVIALYGTDGKRIDAPDVLTYTSDSATFQRNVDGSLSVRIGLTFESKTVPMPDDPVVPVYPKKTEEDPDYTLIIVAACVAILLEIIALIATRRSRN